MKKLPFCLLLFSALAAKAQERPVIKTDTTGEIFRRYENLIKQNSLLPQATFSHNTSRGKIYTLPIDNMPCLVPDMKQVEGMPRQNMPDSRMPNAFPRLPLIPRDKK